MTDKLRKHTKVELLTSNGLPYVTATVLRGRKVRNQRLRELFGEYEYYVEGASFGSWLSSKFVRAAEPGRVPSDPPQESTG